MLTEEDTKMNVAWGRALIAVGAIVALLTLGALEMLTARLPAGEPVAGLSNSDDGRAEPWRDFLDTRSEVEDRNVGSTPVNERSEGDR